MEIEPYSDFGLVKKRYRELALLYHPDKNPRNKHAEEYFKILTQGYNLLSEPEDKELYDRHLKNYYLLKQSGFNPSAKTTVSDDLKAKIRRNKEQRRQSFIESYLRDENVFPHRYRYILAILIFVSGVLMCYNHWFINLLNFKVLYIVAGSFMFGLGSYLISDNIFKRRSFAKAMKIEDFGNEAGPVRTFVLLFFLTPIVFLILMQVTKTIHLKHFYNVTTVDKVVHLNEIVTFEYKVNGVKIMRNADYEAGVDYTDLSGLRVKYSRINPNISELIRVPQSEQP
jgi:hypothetical protein